MIRIALTGPSGSGKGYVCGLLKNRGIESLDCDAVVHRLYSEPAFARRLSEALGSNVCLPCGGVDRRALAPLVFTDRGLMKKVQDLVYPAVRAACLAFLEEQEQAGALAAVVDAPQLFEAGFEKDYDWIVCITAPRDQRLSRIMKRDGISQEAALLRMSGQMTDEQYAARSHALLSTAQGKDVEGALDALLRQKGVCG